MTSVNNPNPEKHEIRHCGWPQWCGRRFSHLRVGLLMLIIGLLWMAKKAGWFPADIFGPLIFILIGAALALTGYFRNEKPR